MTLRPEDQEIVDRLLADMRAFELNGVASGVDDLIAALHAAAEREDILIDKTKRTIVEVPSRPDPQELKRLIDDLESAAWLGAADTEISRKNWLAAHAALYAALGMSERREGKRRLVYDKTKRTIVEVPSRPDPDELKRLIEMHQHTAINYGESCSDEWLEKMKIARAALYAKLGIT